MWYIVGCCCYFEFGAFDAGADRVWLIVVTGIGAESVAVFDGFGVATNGLCVFVAIGWGRECGSFSFQYIHSL